MTIDYAAVKDVHVAAAATSLTLFLLRARWMLWSPARLETRWVRVVPHLVDTVLLASAVWLAWQLGADGTRGWLAAKLIAVLVYMAAGTVALKRGRTRGSRRRARRRAHDLWLHRIGGVRQVPARIPRVALTGP